MEGFKEGKKNNDCQTKRGTGGEKKKCVEKKKVRTAS